MTEVGFIDILNHWVRIVEKLSLESKFQKFHEIFVENRLNQNFKIVGEGKLIKL